MIKLRNAGLLLVLCLFCCRKPYLPPAVSSPNSYLVVEGVINPGTDTTQTTIKLSKTVKLSDTVTTNPVLGATVTVESEHGGTWTLIDVNRNGNYSSSQLGLPATQKYRLKIITGDGKQYASDLMDVKPTPPIDSIGFYLKNNGAQLYVNAHDPTNSTRYYRWEYNETWRFGTFYPSQFVLDTVHKAIVQRRQDQRVDSCYGNSASSHIVLNSTANLEKDVIFQSPLLLIPLSSEKFEVKYSILVKQYALTKEAYTFYTNLEKSTEQLGSIFDAQPSQLMGNIHNMKDPTEPVIGYITVANVQTKRIFISKNELPKGTAVDYPYKCLQDTAFVFINPGRDVFSLLIKPPVTEIPTYPLYYPDGTIWAYLFSSPECTVCTLRGTTKKPDFWQ